MWTTGFLKNLMDALQLKFFSNLISNYISYPKDVIKHNGLCIIELNLYYLNLYDFADNYKADGLKLHTLYI